MQTAPEYAYVRHMHTGYVILFWNTYLEFTFFQNWTGKHCYKWTDISHPSPSANKTTDTTPLQMFYWRTTLMISTPECTTSSSLHNGSQTNVFIVYSLVPYTLPHDVLQDF
jgi:hypothetical protein